ncbi:PTS transporter subunit IIC [Macrococcus bovicus]|uniref:PTS transporter subunit IIC n=1 Tax=Macrococcus bovicus TaxID=69968 RepID=UPI0025A61FB5|nr:PTS transporter subunit IIC [Macrococcus bovicus]WJP97901.1 PTS transporter subunit IIC [Macrococcus bovicus]
MDQTVNRISAKDFINKVLAGVALGIVVGLIPNAILGELFKALTPYHPIFATLNSVVVGIQFTVPVLVGVLIGMQFKLNPIQTVIVGTAAFVGSGAAIFKENAWVLTGIGDLINTMITASIAVLLILWIKDRLGSLTIILLPIIAGGIAGFIGIILLPYVKLITSSLGQLINSFTTLQPIVMCLLIAISFSILIVSPISTVAISMAIGISGLASGAANLGVAAAACMLVVGTVRVNKAGVPIAVFLGAMKMMMPNLLKYPIIALPIALTAAVTGVAGSLMGIQGTKESAGFGFSGLVGPINAFKFMEGNAMMNLLLLILVYFVIPFVSAFIFHYLFTKVFKLYDSDVFKFQTESEDK